MMSPNSFTFWQTTMHLDVMAKDDTKTKLKPYHDDITSHNASQKTVKQDSRSYI